jgi:hypothetical protein
MLSCVNDGVTTINPGYQTSGKARLMVKESSFMLFPTSGRVYIWKTPKEAIIRNARFQQFFKKNGTKPH